MTKVSPETHILTPQVAADLPTLRTAQALQMHQEWVSQDSHLIPDLVAKAGFSLLGSAINPITTGGQAYVALRDHQAVIAFRGSGGDNLKETALNALADANMLRAKPREIVPTKGRSPIRVHMGFYENYLEFRDDLRGHVRALDGQEIYVTGFSLGSALATFCALDLALNDGFKVTLHGMGTPRVGNAAFGELLTQHVPNMLRTVLVEDPVSRVPAQAPTRRSFRHAGGLLMLNEDGSPVPLAEINGRVLDSPRLRAHNRNKYAASIASLIDHVIAEPNLLQKLWGDSPLHGAAEAEREPLIELLDHDDDD